MDRAALSALYDTTDGANWTQNTNWSTTAGPLGMARSHHRLRWSRHAAESLEQRVNGDDPGRAGRDPTQAGILIDVGQARRPPSVPNILESPDPRFLWTVI